MKLRKILLITLCIACAGTVLTQAGERGEILDPNLAKLGDLKGLPEVNEEIADGIVAGRPYLSAKQLDSVLADSLEREQREAVYAHLFRQINLNNASRDEIMVIPGMTSRMAHEFEFTTNYSLPLLVSTFLNPLKLFIRPIWWFAPYPKLRVAFFFRFIFGRKGVLWNLGLLLSR